MMTAIRLGLAQAVGGMVTVELLLIAVGLGRLMLTYRAEFDAASLYASVLLVMAEAVALIRFAELFERRFGSWSGTEVIE
jgi:ABC-type nitrate/sulfonate/bicarbonate transport system permease component